MQAFQEKPFQIISVKFQKEISKTYIKTNAFLPPAHFGASSVCSRRSQKALLWALTAPDGQGSDVARTLKNIVSEHFLAPTGRPRSGHVS